MDEKLIFYRAWTKGGNFAQPQVNVLLNMNVEGNIIIISILLYEKQWQVSFISTGDRRKLGDNKEKDNNVTEWNTSNIR